jgi:hypothetical protein
MEFLGVPAQGEELAFPLNDADYQDIDAISETKSLSPGVYVCIHVGACMPERRWPVENFAAAALGLIEGGWPIVLTGTAAEADIAEVAQPPEVSGDFFGVFAHPVIIGADHADCDRFGGAETHDLADDVPRLEAEGGELGLLSCFGLG